VGFDAGSFSSFPHHASALFYPFFGPEFSYLSIFFLFFFEPGFLPCTVVVFFFIYPNPALNPAILHSTPLHGEETIKGY